MSLPDQSALEAIYGAKVKEALERFGALEKGFEEHFGSEREPVFFTAPGRTEIIGNHTDHNGGKVIAASIDLDTIGAACINDTDQIHVISEGYPAIDIDLNAIDRVPKESGTLSLIAGMAEGARQMGFQAGGFDLYASTNVVAAAGISSSASFEMLIAVIFNEFFNEGRMSCSDYAIIGQYAENHFWNKASGRMDQMACAVGGAIELDFAEEIQCGSIPFSFEEYGYRMVITNTGKGHADLSEEYSAVPREMFAVAKAMGREKLCQLSLLELLGNLKAVADQVQNDRAILRAIHFLRETARVQQMSEKVREKDIAGILGLMKESGRSSYELLQNCYLSSDTAEQPIALALALTDCFLENADKDSGKEETVKKGICRVHGGGFAGVIQAIVPEQRADAYVDYMAGYYGRENVYSMNIRRTGAVRIN